MEVKELINRIYVLYSDIYKYITDTEHWLFYWIANKEVQDFIKEYPEDYEDMVHICVENIGASSMIRIAFDEHPNDIKSIQRYAVLSTFRDSVKARWLEWNGKVKEVQIKEKEKELAYYKKKVGEIENEILELKNT